MQPILLTISLLSLAAGPLVWHLLQRQPAGQRRRFLWRALDAFVLVSITVLLVGEVLPDALERAGLVVLAAFSAGLLLPLLLERLFRSAARTMHLLALTLALLGIILHTLVDGAMLAGGDVGHLGSSGNGLALAIALHRLPVALAVWWLLHPALGARWSVTTLLLMGCATTTGYVAGSHVEVVHELVATAWLQALTAGMILHAVFNRPHLDRRPPLDTVPAPLETPLPAESVES